MMNLDINEHLEKREYEDNLDYNDMIYAKINEGYHDLVLNFLKKVPNTDRKGKMKSVHKYFLYSEPYSLYQVNMLMDKNAARISGVLDFLSKTLMNKDMDNKNYQETKETLGIETLYEGEKTIFYLVKCEQLGGLSLLEYIDSHNVRLSRQREELIDLSVKIANLNHTQRNKDEVVVDSERAMKEVIRHYKSGLASGVGLRDMIVMIKERYPWSHSQKNIMILVSLLTCLLGIGLYIVDVKTDVQFSLEMLNKTDDNTADDFLSLQNCWIQLSTTSENWNEESQQNAYCNIAYISLWHCIQPFLFVLIVAFNRTFTGRNQERGFASYLCFCFLPGFWKIPIPALTHLYRFWLDTKWHSARCLPNFKEEIIKIEGKIQKHEASVILALVLEASLESNFQFWLQINYSLPDILAIILDVSKYEDLINWRTISILLSFITISYSVIKIRFKSLDNI